jgi:hypothetical protein
MAGGYYYSYERKTNMFATNQNSSYKRSKSSCALAMALLTTVVVALGKSFASARAVSTHTPWQNLAPLIL